MPWDLLRNGTTRASARDPLLARAEILPASCDVLVAGGGPIALALAVLLRSKTPGRSVCLLSPGPLGADPDAPRWSVSAPGLPLAPPALDPLLVRSRETLATLGREAGINPMLSPRGLWWLGEGQAGGAAALADRCAALAQPCTPATEDARAARLPVPEDPDGDRLWLPGGLLFDASALTWALARLARRHGVRLVQGVPLPQGEAADALAFDGDRVETRLGTVRAGQVILADDRLIAAHLSLHASASGYSRLRTVALKPLFDPVLVFAADDCAVLQAPSGEVQAIGAGPAAGLAARVLDRLPALRELVLRESRDSACLRGPDGLPLLGTLSDGAGPNLLVAGGFAPWEAALAPAAAAALAALIDGDGLPSDLSALSPDRQALRGETA